MLNFDFVTKKAKEANIDSITIEREYWQLLLLQRLYFSKKSENLFFKGGTAIRFLFDSFRFSEDLDFTAIGGRKTVENLIIKTFDFFKKNTIFELELKKEKVYLPFEEESLRYRFLFKPQKSKQKVSIRIDVSFREKPLLPEQTVLTPFDYPIQPYPIVVHLKDKEMLAEKIRAIFIRGKPRDLFDLWFLLTKKVQIDRRLVDKKFSLYKNITYDLNKLKGIIEKYNEAEIKKDLSQFLPTQFREFYKKIKQELLKLI